MPDVMTAMPHRTRIKICGLTRERDVDAAVQAGADALGFVLYPNSPRAVTVDRALQLASRLPAFVTPVLLLVNQDAAGVVLRIGGRAPAASPFVFQFHGDETPEECAAAGVAYIRAARVRLGHERSVDLIKFSQEYASAQAVLVDAHVEGYGGSGKTFDWTAIAWSHPQLNASSRIVLSGGLSPVNVGEAIECVRPWAVDVSSGVELDALGGGSQKGLKDPNKMVEFVRAVRAADDKLSKS